jgi:branched-chain amino acid transport system substrate-binding protein
MTAGAGSLWVTDPLYGRFPVGNTPDAVTVSAAGVLVSAVGGSQAAGAAGGAAPAGGAVAADSCGGVISGGVGRPRYLIVADLALDPGDATYTQRMAQAVAYELRAHHFSAGHYSLGLQVCDNSGTNGCVANPKAYAATPTVIGVIGPNHSDCAGYEIPVLSRAGLAMVAPTPNAPWLTGPIRGVTLYPTGTRNFVRLSFDYNQEGVAAAHLAGRLGLHRVYVYLDDPKGGYGSFMVQPFARAARRLGIHVIGPDSPTGGFRRLARSLKAKGVDGLFLASQKVDPQFIRALRHGLGRSATLIGSDTFLPLASSAPEARQAERGMYVLGEDITDPARQLPPAGRTFADAFGATRPAGTSDPWAPAAAQATDVLLTAIARSDGTRASVIHQLFRVRVRNGILGSFGFTPRGDISPATLLVYRVIQGRALTRPVTTIRVPAAAG